MPCFAANFSARARSRAATATTSTPSTSRAGFTSAAGVIRAAPRVAIRNGSAMRRRLEGEPHRGIR